MMKRSAGILPYKFVDNQLYIYLEHPGGPYWQNKDLWSICTCEYKNESALSAALRELKEESGFELKNVNPFFIGSKKQKSTNKLVTIFAVNTNLDPQKIKSNTFTIEWPPSSKRYEEFPEMDKASWFSIADAQKKYFLDKNIFLKN